MSNKLTVRTSDNGGLIIQELHRAYNGGSEIE